MFSDSFLVECPLVAINLLTYTYHINLLTYTYHIQVFTLCVYSHIFIMLLIHYSLYPIFQLSRIPRFYSLIPLFNGKKSKALCKNSWIHVWISRIQNNFVTSCYFQKARTLSKSQVGSKVHSSQFEESPAGQVVISYLQKWTKNVYLIKTS